MAKHKLDRLFSDQLEDFSAAPTVNAWEQIENHLDQKEGRGYWAWVGIAASAVLLLASSWLILNQPTEVEVDHYVYAETRLASPALPAEVVYVPIYIHTVIQQPVPKVLEPKKTVVPKSQPLFKEQDVILTKTKEIPVERPEIITLEDVPVVSAEDVLIASAEIPVAQKPANLQPVTIIYKQGESAKESNFVKALNYMEDVRMGEKKLVNFDKLKENFRSRFKSEEETD